MELKKNPRADLRRYAGLFYEAGLVVALCATLTAFNYTNHEKNRMVFSNLEEVDFDDVLIPITHPTTVTPPPAPPKPAEVITIIDSESELEETIEIDDVEATQETVIATIDRTDEEEDAEPEIFFKAEVDPTFPGGTAALYQFISETVKYPREAQENGIVGKVYVRFVINKNGEVENAYIFRGIDPSLDREAIRVVEALPKWTPGTQRGRPVKVWFTMPINFQLN